MSNYTQVQEALSQGVAPSLICSTCRWKRMCIKPPEMTKSEIDQKMAEQQSQNESTLKKMMGDSDDPDSQEGKALGSLVGTLMTSLLFAGKDRIL